MALRPYEDYALQNNRLHPECRAILAPFFSRHVLDNTKVRVLTNVFDWVNVVGLRGCMVLMGTITVIPGLLDANAQINKVTWSWTTPIGIANWAHEIVHVEQWQRHPGVVLAQYAKGLVKSWWKGKWYIHDYFPYEQEAFVVEQKVRDHYYPRGY